MVLTLIRALLGDRLSCPRRSQCSSNDITNLASAPGCQDHTTSRPRSVVRPRVKHALRQVAAIASHLACRDDRDTPLSSKQDTPREPQFLEKRKRNFHADGADAHDQIENAGKLRVSAQGFLFVEPARYDAASAAGRDPPV